MPNSLFVKAPPVLPVVATFLLLAVLLGREASTTEDLPVFLPASPAPPVYVGVSGQGVNTGVYQFNDDVSVGDVIKLTGMAASPGGLKSAELLHPLAAGDMLIVCATNENYAYYRLGWLPAVQRMALGIALHPDQMSREDWTALPGIGEVMAERIDNDRQINGEFRRIEALSRVHGIGVKRVQSLSPFFFDPKCL